MTSAELVALLAAADVDGLEITDVKQTGPASFVVTAKHEGAAGHWLDLTARAQEKLPAGVVSVAWVRA